MINSSSTQFDSTSLEPDNDSLFGVQQQSQASLFPKDNQERLLSISSKFQVEKADLGSFHPEKSDLTGEYEDTDDSDESPISETEPNGSSCSRDSSPSSPSKRKNKASHKSEDGRKGCRRKINIEFIENKSRRHVTFSKRKAGLIKKAYELSTLTGTQVLLLVASETGNVYTFATPKLQPLITRPEGKTLIQDCLNPRETNSPTAMNSILSFPFPMGNEKLNGSNMENIYHCGGITGGNAIQRTIDERNFSEIEYNTKKEGSFGKYGSTTKTEYNAMMDGIPASKSHENLLNSSSIPSEFHQKSSSLYNTLVPSLDNNNKSIMTSITTTTTSTSSNNRNSIGGGGDNTNTTTTINTSSNSSDSNNRGNNISSDNPSIRIPDSYISGSLSSPNSSGIVNHIRSDINVNNEYSPKAFYVSK